MEPHDLNQALAVERASEGRFTARVEPGWAQGRGAFGGLVLGLCAQALGQSEPDAARTLRSLSGEIVAPVLPGEVALTTETLRVGSGMSSRAVRLTQGGQVLAHASAIFARTRVTEADRQQATPPAPVDWSGVEVLPVGPPFGPEFAPNFEYRNVGPMPFAGGTELAAEGFIRAHRLTRLGAPELVAYADAFWPTQLAVDAGPRPTATIAFGFQLLADPSTLDPKWPLRYRARGLAVHEGFLSELRELWTLDGRLVAVNPQTFAIIK